jgi:AbrB family looped-hinge helix DNA binding protein
LWYVLGVAHIREVVVIGDRGRLVLPSAVRSALGLKAGARLLLTAEPDGSLRLRPYRTIAEENLGLLSRLGSDGSLVDELLGQRRGEAAVEDSA